MKSFLTSFKQRQLRDNFRQMCLLEQSLIQSGTQTAYRFSATNQALLWGFCKKLVNSMNFFNTLFLSMACNLEIFGKV